MITDVKRTADVVCSSKRIKVVELTLSECFRIENFNGQMLMEVVINALKKEAKTTTDLFIIQAMLKRTAFYKNKLAHCCQGYQLNEFAQNLSYRKFSDGEVIFDENDKKTDSAYILLKGLVAITRDKGGESDKAAKAVTTARGTAFMWRSVEEEVQAEIRGGGSRPSPPLLRR